MVIRHGGLTAAERIKKAAEVCKQECSPYCPYWTEDECHKHMMEDCVEVIAERDERIAIMQESMEALEKRLADHDRIKVIRCADCAWWEANNAEEGDTSGYCRKNAECENALTDMTFFCGSAERR